MVLHRCARIRAIARRSRSSTTRTPNDVNAWRYVSGHGPGDRRWHVEERERAADAAGVAAQQVQLLLGRAAPVHVVSERRERHDVAGSARQQSCAAARAAGDLVVAARPTGCCSRRGSAANLIEGYGTRPNISNYRQDDSRAGAVHRRVRWQRRHSGPGVPVEPGRRRNAYVADSASTAGGPRRRS